MKTDGAYGRTLGRAMGVEKAPAFVSHSMLRVSRIAVTEIRSDNTEIHVTRPVPAEDGILAMAQIRDWPKRFLFEDGRPTKAQPLKAGTVTIFDLRKEWVGVRSTPVHYVCFYLPRAAMAEIAEMENVGLPDEYPNDYCAGNEDVTLSSLARTLLPSFLRPKEANGLFVDHITTAAGAHILRRYGGTGRDGKVKHSLSAAQLNRSRDQLAASLGGTVTLREMARELGMSATEFSGAFRFSTGMEPHRWLNRHRISLAGSLLEKTRLTLAEIAAACGFQSETHMVRSLSKANPALLSLMRRGAPEERS
ncbi:helix-turn-helix transcriptional regulator [Mesorhizobium sp. CU2]|uniref:helix-turn-helix domain-containing protein n=1 Tax=unclassified Mesorhizobium TaxID=325217 RepID=UPI00112DF953|nr:MULTISPECIES: AraC family transcriptional regulator [unclassified Mesorhizobium]TPN83250.1 helix-turn-helix transcriptional regulator [Mesorhizobium sp. CU3]TPO15874.1 helix-turn-helix transcriptional regulator [Mesorhizobium sp. CU2]